MDFRELVSFNIQNNTTNICCTISGVAHTYNDLGTFIENHAQSLDSIPNTRIGLILRNDFNTYAAAIGCIVAGVTFVPINPEYPEQRIKDIIEASEINHCFDSLQSFEFEGINLIHENEKTQSIFREVDHNQYCYILFTSGTTGKPKGVPITYGNLQAFLDGFQNLNYQVSSNDRFLQMFEMTFDLSVVSYVAPLLYGASFHTLDPSLVKPLALYDTLESRKSPLH